MRYPSTRKEGKELGSKYYFTGKECKRGHLSKRLVSNGCCVECEGEYGKRYYEENRNVMIQRANEWRVNNKEKAAVHVRNWANKNPDKVKSYIDTWCKANPDLVSRYDEKRRERLKDATPSWVDRDLVKSIYLKRDELNEKWGTEFVVDHIVPLFGESVCGLHCWENLQLLERVDNASKGNRH